VLYDTDVTYYVTRVYWILQVYDHEMASVVDGCFYMWKAEGRPTRPQQASRQSAIPALTMS
jgi:3-mercaptopyruvate sulfurtransferase SseA